jgi:hypothetical protein
MHRKMPRTRGQTDGAQGAPRGGGGARAAPAGTLVALCPAALTAMYVTLGRAARRASSARKLLGEQKNSTYAFW